MRRSDDKKLLRACIQHREYQIHAIRAEMPYRTDEEQVTDRKCIFDLEREISILRDELKSIADAGN